MVCSVDAADYQLKISLAAGDFLGECNGEKLNAIDGNAWGECVGNFFNPTIPNPINILSPISGDNLKEKIDMVNILNPLSELNAKEFLEKFINIPLVLIFSIIELLGSAIKYLFVFGFKFVFVYLFYISLGFQSFILLLNNQSRGLEGMTKVHVTLAVMATATIVTLLYGGAWITWS